MHGTGRSFYVFLCKHALQITRGSSICLDTYAGAAWFQVVEASLASLPKHTLPITTLHLQVSQCQNHGSISVCSSLQSEHVLTR